MIDLVEETNALHIDCFIGYREASDHALGGLDGFFILIKVFSDLSSSKLTPFGQQMQQKEPNCAS